MSMDSDLNISMIAGKADSQFLPGTNIQFAWDSVSLTSIMACPRRYQYNIIFGLVPNNPSYAIALVFGILFHKGLEVYQKELAKGRDHDEAVHATVRYLVDDPATATLPVDDHIEEMKADHDPDEDDGIALRNSKIRTRYYLLRSVVWYLEHYKDDPCSTIIMPTGKPAVEVSFRLPLGIDVLGTPLLLCGHIDRGVEFNDSYYVMDHKTTKSLTSQFFGMFHLSHQLTGYTVAGNAVFDKPVKGALVDGVALQVGQVKLARAPTPRTQGQIKEYFELLRYIRDRAIEYAEKDSYPMNTSACYFCDYKNICAQPPEYRDRYIRQHYSRKQGWNPLENR